jgi:hypothetical protein
MSTAIGAAAGLSGQPLPWEQNLRMQQEGHFEAPPPAAEPDAPVDAPAAVVYTVEQLDALDPEEALRMSYPRTVLSAKRAPNEYLVLRRAHVRTRVPRCSPMLALHRRSAPSGSAYSAVAAWGDGHPRPVGTCWPSFLGGEHGLTQPAGGKSSCSKFSSSY